MLANAFAANDTNTSLAHSSSNTDSKDKFMARARQYGEDTAKGIDAKPKLFLDMVRMSAQGVVDPYDPKLHNTENPDDTAKAYQVYLEEASDKAIHEHTKDGLKANTSKFRTAVNLGRHPHVDGEELMDRVVGIYAQTRAAQGPKAVLPAFEVYVNSARAQMKSESALTDDEIKGLCLKPERQGPELEDFLQKQLNAFEKLVAGEIKGKDGNLRDQSEQVLSIVDLIKERLATFVTDRKKDALYQLQVELGMIPAQIESYTAGR